MGNGTRASSVRRSRGGIVGITLLLVGASSLRAQTVLTLDEALREARAANARLPVAQFDAAVASAAVSEARGQLLPSLEVQADLHDGAPPDYASADARLQLVASVPIYDGGRLRANVRGARARRDQAVARVRIAEKDVDFSTRVSYAAILAVQDEIAARQAAIERLRNYVDFIGTQEQAGEPVSADLMRGRVRLDRARADLADARRRLAEAHLDLNELLGRAPEDSLVLAPLPAPAVPGMPTDEPWQRVPEAREAGASIQEARSEVSAARAGRRPHLDLSINGGAEPALEDDTSALLNTGQGTGVEATLSFSWPIWDWGVYRSRLDQARFSLRRSEASRDQTLRQARFDWKRARVDLERLYEEIELRSGLSRTARDAYLHEESLYRGGQATFLEVLDAFDEWSQAAQDFVHAVQSYRDAEARLERWGSP